MHPNGYAKLGTTGGASSISDFCKRYGIGRTFAYELIKDRKLRAVKCHNRTLILDADAESWARSLPELGAVK